MISTRLQLEKEANQIAEKWVQANWIQDLLEAALLLMINMNLTIYLFSTVYSFIDPITISLLLMNLMIPSNLFG